MADGLEARAADTFDRILDVSPPYRGLALRLFTVGDPDLHDRVAALLGRDATAGGALDRLVASGAPPEPGAVLGGRYTLEREIGAGGSGTVFEARDGLSGQPVAVKVLRGDWPRAHGRRERAILRGVRVPGVVRILDEGSHGGAAFLVTSLVDGAPFPGRDLPATWEEIEPAALGLLEALGRIHLRGVVHADLKPGNVLVDEGDVITVLDLGTSFALGAAASERVRALTRAYAAPEQVAGERPDVRADLYAVGVMLHEALLGKRPGAGPPAAIDTAGLQARAPGHVVRAIQGTLAASPEARPRSAGDLLDAIRGDLHSARDERRAAWRAAWASETGVEPRALTNAQLVGLFVGHDRLFRIREDAAHALVERTDGIPDEVFDELDAWHRAGLGRWEGRYFHLTRRDLATLRGGARLRIPSVTTDGDAPALDRGMLRTLLAIEHAGGHAPDDLLAAVLEIDHDRLGERMKRLVEGGMLRVAPTGRREVVWRGGSSDAHVAAERRWVHERLARTLPTGDPARFQHWLLAGQPDAAAAAARDAAAALRADGDVHGARAILTEGLREVIVGTTPGVPAEELLLGLLQCALQTGTEGPLDHFLYVAGTVRETPQVRRLEAIARAGLRAIRGDVEAARADLISPRDCATDDERRCAVSAALFVARRLPDAEERLRMIEEAAALGRELEVPAIQIAATSALGWVAYGDDDFARAAALHREVAELATTDLLRNNAHLSAASALMEAGAFDQAEALARGVIPFAVEGRHALFEARAEWIARAAAYRRGEVLAPDAKLALAAADIGEPNLGALIALNEAAAAWRAGQALLAEQLGRLAARQWEAMGARDPALLARALVCAAAPAASEPTARTLLEDVRDIQMPTLRLQAAALLAGADPSLVPEASDLIRTVAAETPAARPDLCMEILSIADAMKSVQGNP